jgi:hypothetical protein
MRARYFRLVFLVLWCCCSTGAIAQTSIKITGTILHAETRKPLQSITILKTSTGRGTISDADGQFRLMVQPNDTLVIRAVGFKTSRYVVHARAQADFSVEILLEEGALELPEVKVVGGLDYEKVNRVLRNMKKPPPPKVAVKPKEPEPLFPETKGVPPPPSLENPASLLYDVFSKEGKDRRRLEAMLEEEAQKKKALEEKKKQQAYDSLFQDRNKPFRE